MKLRLAEYKDGKFERFLELGKDFLYGGDFIIFTRSSGYFFIDTACQEYREQFKDQKDPLNRFNGLFDGRTYGKGRFVLVKDEEQTYQIILNELSEKFEAKMADECGFERYLWKGTKEYKERFSKEKEKVK